ncbi:serine hydrolase domain-containing protein [Maricaulis parjimensis]|uniref:serine hydrolase domain-containing protein n=1 Tax=Maricaulis parjimensis TaxID=144023 RepID=UPI00193A70D7|nr:serine hydrolase domain-containing protein [Maricaulis parjimensis]
MKLRAALVGLLVLSASLTALGLRPQASMDPDSSDDELAAHLDAVLDRAMSQYSIAGAAAGAIRDGEVVWRARRGRSDGDGAPVTDMTAFNLGSISKPLTVWTVLRLAQAGRIDLDAPLSDYDLPYTPAYEGHDPQMVTIRRLLRHTAGTNQPGYGGYGAHEVQPADVLELSRDFAPLRVVHEPGAARRYSGGGYVLLQILVEQVTGQSFDQAARHWLLDPLGMTASGFDPARLPTVSEAFNYYGRPIESLRDVAQTAAGGYASAGDIERFLLAHMDGGGVLAPDFLSQALAPTEPHPGFAMSYTRWETPDGFLYGHGGNNSTWHGQIYIRPQTGDGFYFLTNSTSGAQLDIDLSCAWLSQTGSPAGETYCGEAFSLTHQIAWYSWGFGAAGLFWTYWLLAGQVADRRYLALQPAGRGPVRLTGRLALAVLMAGISAFLAWVFWTNSVIWRTETILIDELPFDELEGLSLTLTFVFAILALCFWSSPRRSGR